MTQILRLAVVHQPGDVAFGNSLLAADSLKRREGPGPSCTRGVGVYPSIRKKRAHSFQVAFQHAACGCDSRRNANVSSRVARRAGGSGGKSGVRKRIGGAVLGEDDSDAPLACREERLREGGVVRGRLCRSALLIAAVPPRLQSAAARDCKALTVFGDAASSRVMPDPLDRPRITRSKSDGLARFLSDKLRSRPELLKTTTVPSSITDNPLSFFHPPELCLSSGRRHGRTPPTSRGRGWERQQTSCPFRPSEGTPRKLNRRARRDRPARH